MFALKNKYFMDKMKYYVKDEYLTLSVNYLNKVGKATITIFKLLGSCE